MPYDPKIDPPFEGTNDAPLTAHEHLRVEYILSIVAPPPGPLDYVHPITSMQRVLSAYRDNGWNRAVRSLLHIHRNL